MSDADSPDATDLPPVLWLWPVVLVGGALLVAAFADPDVLRAVLAKDRDGGVVEHLTVLVLLPGIAAGALTVLRHRATLPATWVAVWVATWTAACVYFAGEEISWGQWIFGWETPAALEAVNDQGETNLHNISSWLDQKPRALVETWIAVAGLVLPVVRRMRGVRLDAAEGREIHRGQAAAHWVLPTRVGVAAAAAMLLTRLPEPIGEALSLPKLVPLSSSELRELFIASFLCLYLLSIHRRARARGE